jgi:hypothetical protein
MRAEHALGQRRGNYASRARIRAEARQLRNERADTYRTMHGFIKTWSDVRTEAFEQFAEAQENSDKMIPETPERTVPPGLLFDFESLASLDLRGTYDLLDIAWRDWIAIFQVAVEAARDVRAYGGNFANADLHGQKHYTVNEMRDAWQSAAALNLPMYLKEKEFQDQLSKAVSIEHPPGRARSEVQAG